MKTEDLIAEVLQLVCDALQAGKDGRRSNPKYYTNRIKWLLDKELPKKKKKP